MDRLESGLALPPFTKIIEFLVKAHLGSNDGQFLGREFVISNQLIMRFDAGRGSRPARFSHTENLLSFLVRCQKII